MLFVILIIIVIIIPVNPPQLRESKITVGYLPPLSGYPAYPNRYITNSYFYNPPHFFLALFAIGSKNAVRTYGTSSPGLLKGLEGGAKHHWRNFEEP